jgi:hypothetical protein
MKFYPRRAEKQCRNAKGGSQMAELGPALLVLFVIILVPMLDILYLGLAYAAGWYCNHLVVREVACRQPSQWIAAAGSATKAWQSSGLALFIHANTPLNVANFQDASGNPAGSGQTTPPIGFCVVSTTITIQPFLPIPFLTSVAGINAPVTFTYSAQRPQEEKGLN